MVSESEQYNDLICTPGHWDQLIVDTRSPRRLVYKTALVGEVRMAVT